MHPCVLNKLLLCMWQTNSYSNEKVIIILQSGLAVMYGRREQYADSVYTYIISINYFKTTVIWTTKVSYLESWVHLFLLCAWTELFLLVQSCLSSKIQSVIQREMFSAPPSLTLQTAPREGLSTCHCCLRCCQSLPLVSSVLQCCPKFHCQ